MSSRLTRESPPMSQKVMAGRVLIGSATNLIRERKAWKRAETTIPPRTSTTRESRPTRRPMRKAQPTANSPRAKAAAWMPDQPREASIPMAAPKLAPAETPRMPGETRGFLKRFW